MDDRSQPPPERDDKDPAQPESLEQDPWPQPEIGDDGQPLYDQTYFLTLAAYGREIWNQWRTAHREKEGKDWAESDSGYIHVTFADVDFAENDGGRVNFSGFDFGHGADFSNANFGDEANLSDATFDLNANLSGARFGNGANLSRARMNLEANLSGTSFGDDADLTGATFIIDANLSNARFGHRVNLSGASFGSWTNLSGASFGNDARLAFTSFGDYANLSGASFNENADLSGASFGSDADLSDVHFGDGVIFKGFSREEWHKNHLSWLDGAILNAWTKERKQVRQAWPTDAASRPDRWSSISFAGAHFEGHADFTGRTAGDDVDFTSVRFDQPPTFDSFDGYDLYGARIGFQGHGFSPRPKIKWPLLRQGWTADSTIGNQLRRLRKLAEPINNHDLERDLYIEERKAERGIYFVKYWQERNVPRLLAHLAWIAVMGLYWLLADYGRSFLRPLAWLIASVIIFHAALWFALGPNMPSSVVPRAVAAASHITDWVRPNLSGFGQAARGYALAHAVPFLGPLTLDKDARTVLICRGDAACVKTLNGQTAIVTPFRLQALTLVQSFLSTLCFFFAGLALRNYFRVK